MGQDPHSFGDPLLRALPHFSPLLLFPLTGHCVCVAQLCLTLNHPVDYIVYGTLQARILELVAVPFSRGSSQHRDKTQVSCIAGRFFTS